MRIVSGDATRIPSSCDSGFQAAGHDDAFVAQAPRLANALGRSIARIRTPGGVRHGGRSSNPCCGRQVGQPPMMRPFQSS